MEEIIPMPKKQELKRYPYDICHECGMTAKTCLHPLRKQIVATYRVAQCAVCGETKEVTEPRDYGYPKFKGFSDG